MTYGPRPAGGPVPPMKLPEYHNTCTVCGVPCSCKGGIKVRVLHEDGTRDEATAIMCGDCADIVRWTAPHWGVTR
jgi:hypothetical protein